MLPTANGYPYSVVPFAVQWIDSYPAIQVVDVESIPRLWLRDRLSVRAVARRGHLSRTMVAMCLMIQRTFPDSEWLDRVVLGQCLDTSALTRQGRSHTRWAA